MEAPKEHHKGTAESVPLEENARNKEQTVWLCDSGTLHISGCERNWMQSSRCSLSRAVHVGANPSPHRPDSKAFEVNGKTPTDLNWVWIRSWVSCKSRCWLASVCTAYWLCVSMPTEHLIDSIYHTYPGLSLVGLSNLTLASSLHRWSAESAALVAGHSCTG